MAARATGALEQMPRNFVGAVVCKSIEDVQAIASQLGHELSQSERDRDQSFRRIVLYTSASADYSLVKAIDMPGTILVFTEQTYNRFDWSTVDFAFVATKLRQPELVAFPRLSRKHDLTVFDYSGSFELLGLGPRQTNSSASRANYTSPHLHDELGPLRRSYGTN